MTMTHHISSGPSLKPAPGMSKRSLPATVRHPEHESSVRCRAHQRAQARRTRHAGPQAEQQSTSREGRAEQDGDAVPTEEAGVWLKDCFAKKTGSAVDVIWMVNEEHDRDTYYRLVNLLFGSRSDSPSL